MAYVIAVVSMLIVIALMAQAMHVEELIDALFFTVMAVMAFLASVAFLIWYLTWT